VTVSSSGPVARRLIVEADGGSRGNPGPAGYGAVVVDAATGQVLAEIAEAIGRATNNVAEYRGLIAGLRAAARLAPGAAVEARMDAKLVVEQMSGRWRIKHPDLQPLARAARAAASGLGPVSYVWVPRERNYRADRLANEAMDGTERLPRGSRHSAGGVPPGDRAARVAPEDLPPAARAGSPAAGAAESAAASAAAAAPMPYQEGFDLTGSGLTGSGVAGSGLAGSGLAGSGLAGSASVGTAFMGTAAAGRVAWAGDHGQPTTTVLLRHGQTPLSAQQRFAGAGDIELTDVGVAQARAAARRLAARFDVGTGRADRAGGVSGTGAADGAEAGSGASGASGAGFGVILSSPLRRAKRTAAEVAGLTGVPLRVDEDLRETDFGAWEGLTFAEVQQGWPAELAAWLADAEVAPPGGESFAAVGERVLAALDRLRASYAGETVLLVSHVTPIKTLLRHALLAPAAALYRMHLDVASLCEIQWFADGPAVVRSVNDTAHLNGYR
jgi:probable phosphoglycerate mutase